MALLIGLFGTARCDTGCRHCLCNSTSRGDDLPLEAIKELEKSIKKHPRKVHLCFTGCGEPLMWPHLPEAISRLSKLENVSSVALMSSGCLSEQDDRLPVLKEAIKAEESLVLNHSFHLYHPSFSQRLAFILPWLLKNNKGRLINVRTVLGFLPPVEDSLREETRATFDQLEKVIKQTVGPCATLSFPDWSSARMKELEFFLRCGRRYSVWEEALWAKASDLMVYLPRDLSFQQTAIRVVASWVSLRGRAKKCASWQTAAYCYLWGFCCHASTPSIELFPNGDFIFCSDPAMPRIKLGTAGGSLEKALKRKIRIAKTLAPRDLFLRDWKSFDPCDSCANKAWELYGAESLKTEERGKIAIVKS